MRSTFDVTRIVLTSCQDAIALFTRGFDPSTLQPRTHVQLVFGIMATPPISLPPCDGILRWIYIAEALRFARSTVLRLDFERKLTVATFSLAHTTW
jgi:hypothetical protein